MRANVFHIVIESALLVGLGFLYTENRALRREANEARVPNPVLLARADQASVRSDARPSNLVSSGAEAAASTSTPFDPSAPWRDPKYRETQFNSAVIQIEQRYGRFFAQLKNWPPEKIEALKQQLARNQLAIAEAGTPHSTHLSPDEVKQLGQAVTQAFNANDASLKASLPPEDYENFKLYQVSESARPSIEAVTNAMRSKGVAVSGDLEDSILTAYATATKESADEGSKLDISEMDPNQVSALRDQQKKAFQLRLMQHLSGVLNEQQLNAFMESSIEQDSSG